MEKYELNYYMMARGEHEKYMDALMYKPCVCGHVAMYHTCHRLRHPDRLSDEIGFSDCEGKNSCGCYMFKQDNLRYLEEVALQKAKAAGL